MNKNNTNYMRNRAVFVGRNHETLSYGYTGVAFTDASSGRGYWFRADGLETAINVPKNEIWFDEDGYVDLQNS